MRKNIALLVVGLSLGLSQGLAHAADEKTPTSQQSKMKTCNADAKEKALQGDPRKAFMKECLSAAPAPQAGASAPTTQQGKMKTCNVNAKEKSLQGAERKAFMKECLSAK